MWRTNLLNLNLLKLGLYVCELLKVSFICLLLFGWTLVWNVGNGWARGIWLKYLYFWRTFMK